MAKRNKTTNNRKSRPRYVGGEKIAVPKLGQFGTIRGLSRIDGVGAVLIVDLDTVELTVAISPLEAVKRGYQG